MSKESEVNFISETWKEANLLPLIHLFPSMALLNNLMMVMMVVAAVVVMVVVIVICPEYLK